MSLPLFLSLSSHVIFLATHTQAPTKIFDSNKLVEEAHFVFLLTHLHHLWFIGPIPPATPPRDPSMVDCRCHPMSPSCNHLRRYILILGKYYTLSAVERDALSLCRRDKACVHAGGWLKPVADSLP